MKKFFYLMSLCLCMFMGAVALSSCGDDADDIIDDLEDGNITTTASVSIGANKDVLVITYKNAWTETHTALFTNDECTSYIVVYDFKSETLADAMWADAKDEDGYTRNSKKKITYDSTETFEGTPKSVMDQVFNSMAEEYNSGRK